MYITPTQRHIRCAVTALPALAALLLTPASQAAVSGCANPLPAPGPGCAHHGTLTWTPIDRYARGFANLAALTGAAAPLPGGAGVSAHRPARRASGPASDRSHIRTSTRFVKPAVHRPRIAADA